MDTGEAEDVVVAVESDAVDDDDSFLPLPDFFSFCAPTIKKEKEERNFFYCCLVLEKITAVDEQHHHDEVS
jgi:hypothetical protein